MIGDAMRFLVLAELSGRNWGTVSLPCDHIGSADENQMRPSDTWMLINSGLTTNSSNYIYIIYLFDI